MGGSPSLQETRAIRAASTYKDGGSHHSDAYTVYHYKNGVFRDISSGSASNPNSGKLSTSALLREQFITGNPALMHRGYNHSDPSSRQFGDADRIEILRTQNDTSGYVLAHKTSPVSLSLSSSSQDSNTNRDTTATKSSASA